jgi:hypothetical protein
MRSPTLAILSRFKLETILLHYLDQLLLKTA